MVWVFLLCVAVAIIGIFADVSRRLVAMRKQGAGCESCRYLIVDFRGSEYCYHRLERTPVPCVRVCFDYSPRLVKDVRKKV